ncbi:MAG: tryptophan-rich sensory protein [Spirochaetes bacterium]|nr:tryptophan-rich sensory protein [Spirochaetota bacterium]
MSAFFYRELIRSGWAPPAWLFGPVWSVLYTIIAISYGYVFYRILTGLLPRILALPFLSNLIFNAAFSPLQFGLQNNLLALIDLLLLGTLLWAMVAIYPHARWVALVNLPYLGWVTFATILQGTITYLTW